MRCARQHTAATGASLPPPNRHLPQLLLLLGGHTAGKVAHRGQPSVLGRESGHDDGALVMPHHQRQEGVVESRLVADIGQGLQLRGRGQARHAIATDATLDESVVLRLALWGARVSIAHPGHVVAPCHQWGVPQHQPTLHDAQLPELLVDDALRQRLHAGRATRQGQPRHGQRLLVVQRHVLCEAGVHGAAPPWPRVVRPMQIGMTGLHRSGARLPPAHGLTHPGQPAHGHPNSHHQHHPGHPPTTGARAHLKA